MTNTTQFFSYTIYQLLNPVHSGFSTTLSDVCEKFLNFFSGKTGSLRADFHNVDHHLNHLTCPVQLAKLNLSLFILLDLVTHMHLSSYPIDIIPQNFLKRPSQAVYQIILRLPVSFLSLKKTSLDTSNKDNHRPIFKLPFISKILKKVAAHQLLQLTEGRNIFENFQSGF